MKRVKLSKDTIKGDNLNYGLDGKIEPYFHVIGSGKVEIFGIELELGAKDGFDAGFVDSETAGTIAIEFLDDQADNRVVCVYGVEIETCN